MLMIINQICNGTGDEGDSIMHFLFSKWAFQHPAHFFDHWAKPLYVLLTCLPAQFGFKGIQVFNISINALSIYLTYCVAQRLHIKQAWLAALFLAIFPHQIIYSLSGLTEPLFGFALILTLFLWLSDRKTPAILLLSFLPFIRSEGWVVMVVFSSYLLIKKNYRLLPVLATGHIIYTLIGVAFGKSWLWIFMENPYAMMSSNYGKGGWDSFIINIRYSVGAGMYYVLWAGLLLGFFYAILKFIFKKQVRFSIEEFFLIYGIFFSYFFFHSLAWYKGWFHSFGMIRVMIGVLPCAAIICAKVIDEIYFALPLKRKEILISTLAGCILIFNFSYTKYGVQKVRDLSLRGDQQCQHDVVSYLKKEHPDYRQQPVYFSAAYISELLDIDWFDDDKRPDFRNDFHQHTMKKPCYIIWDDWFSPVEQAVSLEELRSRPEIKCLKEFSHYDTWGNKQRITIVFKIE